MDTKAAILTAAREVFAEKGKHGARMEEIAAKADVNKAMLYYYFTSKDLLFKEVLTIILQKLNKRIIDAIDTIVKSEQQPVEKLKAIMEVHHENFSSDVNATKVLLIGLTSQPEEFHDIMQRISRHGFPNLNSSEQLQELLDEGYARGIFRKIDLQQFLISMIGTHLIYFLAKPIAELTPEFVVQDEQTFLRERKQHVVDLFLYGVVDRGSLRKHDK